MGIKETIYRTIRNANGYVAEIKVREKFAKLTTSDSKISTDRYDGYTIRKGSRINKDKPKYVVMRYEYPLMGLAAAMRDLLLCSFGAEKEGYIPIMDYEISRNIRGTGSLGKRCNNIWERYFQQNPSLEEIIYEKSDMEIVALRVDEIGIYDAELFERLNGDSADHHVRLISGEAGNYYRDYFKEASAKYLMLNVEFKNRCVDIYNKLIGGLKRKYGSKFSVVGVLMREEFSPEHKENIYDKTHKQILSRHPSHKSVDENIAEIKNKFKEWECTHVFLATIYEPTVDRFYQEFGYDKVICLNRARLDSYTKDGLDYIPKDRPYQERMNIETITTADYEIMDAYLTELYLLSRCDYFISGICGGGFIVPLMRADRPKTCYEIT